MRKHDAQQYFSTSANLPRIGGISFYTSQVRCLEWGLRIKIKVERYLRLKPPQMEIPQVWQTELGEQHAKLQIFLLRRVVVC